VIEKDEINIYKNCFSGEYYSIEYIENQIIYRFNVVADAIRKDAVNIYKYHYKKGSVHKAWFLSFRVCIKIQDYMLPIIKCLKGAEKMNFLGEALKHYYYCEWLHKNNLVSLTYHFLKTLHKWFPNFYYGDFVEFIRRETGHDYFEFYSGLKKIKRVKYAEKF